MGKIKIIVAHPGRQHSFRVAKALKDNGLLYKYVTTVYNKDNSLLMRLTKKFLRNEELNRAQKRKCLSLNDEDVVQFCEFEGLLLLALMRLDYKRLVTKAFSRYVSKKFQKKLADYIIKEKIDAVISYDCNSKYLFELLSVKAPNVIKIIDNAHPNRHYLYHSYHEHWDKVGDFAKTMEACGYITDESKSLIFGQEAKLADYHIVASSYSQKALEFEGIPTERIFKIPYGVDDNKFMDSERKYSSDVLNTVFIGDVNQRKGIRELLEVAKEIHGENIIFNIVGTGFEAYPELFQPYGQYVNYLGYVSYETLLDQLKSNHVFVFPTMGEGFGLVLLEAMAAGMPVITTPNCGGPDIVRDGYNGFIVPVCDNDALILKLRWMKDNPDKLKEMSRNAVATAKEFTWGRYEGAIAAAMKTMTKRS